MVVTEYLNSNILKQEAAINIEEEAIKAKKAALNLRKAIDRKVQDLRKDTIYSA